MADVEHYTEKDPLAAGRKDGDAPSFLFLSCIHTSSIVIHTLYELTPPSVINPLYRYLVLKDNILFFYKTDDLNAGEQQQHLLLTGEASVRRQGRRHDESKEEGLRIDRPQDLVIVKTPLMEICFQGSDYGDEAKWIGNLEVK